MTVAGRQIGFPPARPGEPQRLPAAVPPGHAHHQAQKIPSTSHAWAVQHASWNGGKMDNWLPAHRKAEGAKAPYVMGYHTRADIPFQFALAEAFTICDAYSLLGHGTDLAQPHVLDDRHHRRRRRGRRPDDQQQRSIPRRLSLDHLRRAAGEGGRELEGLPAGRTTTGCNMLEQFKAFQEADRNSRCSAPRA